LGAAPEEAAELIRAWWFLALLLAALGLVMGGAHVLELPVRMR